MAVNAAVNAAATLPSETMTAREQGNSPRDILRLLRREKGHVSAIARRAYMRERRARWTMRSKDGTALQLDYRAFG